MSVSSPIFSRENLIISGPCSAETREQVLTTAKQLADIGKVDVLRAGVWKPRTRPGGFEGLGIESLRWMQEARKLTGLPIAVEIANRQHAEEAISCGVDILWVGARTTVNPFSVQEIADTLRGADVHVLIKNPVNPDIELWTGAVERLEKAGIEHIGLIHRGFTSYANTEFRNAPMWHLALEMMRRHPHRIMICDPSHIAGRRSLIQRISQRAVDLEYGGLMIEAHVDPDNAWSDAKQQVSPERLHEILNQINWRKEALSVEEEQSTLSQCRGKIDSIDDELFQLLARRMDIVAEIGKYKKENNLTILQGNRWSSVVNKAKERCQSFSLSDAFVMRFLDTIHIESINIQNEIMNG